MAHTSAAAAALTTSACWPWLAQVHHAAYIKNLNAAVANDPALAKLGLSELVAKVGTGTYPAKQETAIRNSGGGAWNHDLWWSILAPPSSNITPTSR
ncbi:superoxide dismutase, partial [Haematococcus lacustris]